MRPQQDGADERVGEDGEHDDERRDDAVDDQFQTRQSDEVRQVNMRDVRHGVNGDASRRM